MNTLKDYVNFRLTHADKIAEAEGYPLKLENCKKYKPMRDLKVYGNSLQDGTPSPENPIEVQSVGELVTDETDSNYGKYKIPVVQSGINLFNMATTGLKQQTINGITFTPLEDERIHIKGTLEDTTKGAVYNYTFGGQPVFEPGIYNAKNTPFVYSGTDLLFNTTKASGGYLVNINSSANNINITERAYISGIYMGIRAGNTREWDDIWELQVTQGANTKILPYEPYIEPITTNIFLDEPLRKLGDYADYIDFKNNKVVRNVREVVFKGGEITNSFNGYIEEYGNIWWRTDTIYKDANYDAYFKQFGIHPELSTHFHTYSDIYAGSSSLYNNSWSVNSLYRICFVLPIETFASDGVQATMADINAWLASQYEAGTAVTFYYIRNEATEEPINLELPKLTAKTTIIEVDTSLAPSNAYGKYIKR